MEFSDNLKRLRFKKEITQQKLADDLKITRGRYSKWEDGSCEPDISLLVKLSYYHNVTIDDLKKKKIKINE